MIAKKFKKICLFTSIFAVPFSAIAETTTPSSINKAILVAVAEKAQEYKIDENHSKVSFEVAHLVVSSVSGEFKKFNGTFKFNPEDFSETQLDASADASSIDTSVKKRDDHLKSPDFFDTKKTPYHDF